MISQSTILSLLGAGVHSYPCAKGRMGYYVENTERTTFLSVADELLAEGAELVFSRTVGDTDFALYTVDGCFIRVSYIAKRGIVRVITSEEETLFTGYGDLSADGDVEMLLMNMDYIRARHDNGEGLIIKLADGSFLMYDGGYSTEMPALVEYMEANTPKGQKPVISSWLITHSHGDHYWGFESLLKNDELFSRVEIKNVLLTIPTPEQFAPGRTPEPFFTTRVEALLKERDIPLICPWAGQVLHYPGLDLEVLMTVEDLYPLRPWDDNTASSVTFLHFKKAGKDALIPGDSAGYGMQMLTDMYGTYLKCDVLQNPHHGHSGATKTLFDLADPEVVLFCTAEPRYYERILTDTAWNYYLMNRLHVKRAYFADHKYQRII